MSSGNAQPATGNPIMASEATLRDMFAAKALVALIQRSEPTDEPSDVVKCAYGYADGLLASRNSESK